MNISLSIKKHIIANRNSAIIKQFFRYTIVGGGAFIIDFSILYILTEYFSIKYLISAGISFISGLACNYLFSTRWVFDTRKVGNPSKEFLLFLAIGLIGLSLNEIIIWCFTSFWHLYYLISKVFSTVIIFLWNFFARELLLFSK
jgi:putative flippase GtrA